MTVDEMIIGIHHYELAESTTAGGFEAAIDEAEQRGLFDLPGMADWRFLREIRGTHDDVAAL